MRMWLHRAELDAMLTGELQKIAGCERSTLIAGAQIPVADFEHSRPDRRPETLGLAARAGLGRPGASRPLTSV